MSTKRPTSWEEFSSLPIGPAFGARTENGVTIPIAPDVVAFHSEPTELMSYSDGDGGHWTLGRYADGSWFKQRH